ncbi:MAG: type II toxin-antitoxin system HipA family toxin [Motilibacteraceae bacterium]
MSARRQRHLSVYLYDRLAGVLAQPTGSLSFTYEPDYAADPDATPLSLSMPLPQRAHGNKAVTAYLKGLLPDNETVRRRWAARFGVRDGDLFGLVAAVGSDAAGGAIFLPPDVPPTAHGHLEPVSEAQIAERLRRLREDETDWLDDEEHWSLAGAQAKFTLRATDSGWAVAHGLEPSTHIIKPGITRVPAHAATEHVSMRAAAALGLDVARTDFRLFEDQPAIVVTRFDRLVAASGQILRVHQEDLLQALALDPSRKYEADSGPGVQRIVRLFRSLPADFAADAIARFAQALIVNAVLGAPDAHAKNYALLHAGAAVRLAPLYDLASGLLGERGGTLRYPRSAMSIGGERAFGALQRTHWDGLARATGLPVDQITDWVSAYATAAPDALADAINALPRTTPDRDLLTGALLPRVTALAQMTAQGLTQTTRPPRTRKTPADTIHAAAAPASTA